MELMVTFVVYGDCRVAYFPTTPCGDVPATSPTHVTPVPRYAHLTITDVVVRCYVIVQALPIYVVVRCSVTFIISTFICDFGTLLRSLPPHTGR